VDLVELVTNLAKANTAITPVSNPKDRDTAVDGKCATTTNTESGSHAISISASENPFVDGTKNVIESASNCLGYSENGSKRLCAGMSAPVLSNARTYAKE
jgi:hypothetical protein